ncbi:MAG TPA: S-adenosylmethionine:tRNA ribosyltransferase-isomerase [Acidimicrobiia bacterium]|jgi:S-adenosylmethionine:tRNA ribosyltransferase-isomerase
MTLVSGPIDFTLPESRTAAAPAERRGKARDGVRLMVAHRASGAIEHHRFSDLPDLLQPGDVVVVNTSKTIPAAVDALSEDRRRLVVHFASAVSDDLWNLEVRAPTREGGTKPAPDIEPGTLTLPGGAAAQLLARSTRSPRLWVAALKGTSDVLQYLEEHGRPIRYQGGPAWPIRDYQTIFAGEPGSAEMPSAGRPFTPDLVTRLVSKGVTVVPILLHTGVSSYEDDETPGEERYRVPAATAIVVSRLRDAGGRVIAVGTTVVRALETVARVDGSVHAGAGVTDLVVTREHGLRVTDALLTGWHEPRSTHLRLLETVAGRDLLQKSYDEALAGDYLWHEFGDELLILP